MKRETKVGIVVASSFLALVGGVFAVKHLQKPAETTPPPVVGKDEKPAAPSTPTEPTSPTPDTGLNITPPASTVVIDPTPMPSGITIPASPTPSGITLPTPDPSPMPMITISPTPILLPGAEPTGTPVVGSPTIPGPTPTAKPPMSMADFLAGNKDARGILGSALMTKSTLLAKAIRPNSGAVAMLPSSPSGISLDVGTPPAAPKIDTKPMPPEISIAPPPMPAIELPGAPKPMSDPKAIELPGGPITLPGSTPTTPKAPEPPPTINVPKPPDIGLPAPPPMIPTTPKPDPAAIGLPSAPAAPAVSGPTPTPGISITPPIGVPDANSVRSADVRMDSYEEEWYRCQNDDTLEKISQKFFYTPKYGQALRLYNLDRQNSEAFRAENPQLRQGLIVRVPPARVLEWKYPAALGLKPAAASSPAGVTVSNPNPGASIGAAAPARADTTAPNEYKVERPNMTLRDIAKEKLGNSDQWQRIFRLNRWLNPQEPVPEGTMIYLPRP